MKLIKRYQNSKLYDTIDMCYISLAELWNMYLIYDIQVVDNRTMDDITDDILVKSALEVGRDNVHFKKKVILAAMEIK